jgi:hypothetical protein
MILVFVIVALVAVFSYLLKKRYERYPACAKDLEDYVDERPEEHEKERTKVESRCPFQPPSYKAIIDGLLSATLKGCESSGQQTICTYLPGLRG